MNKLKTLKDIEDEYIKSIAEPIRQSAREWIKEIKSYEGNHGCGDDDWEKYHNYVDIMLDDGDEDGIDVFCGEYIINWIKHFFNLDEE